MTHVEFDLAGPFAGGAAQAAGVAGEVRSLPAALFGRGGDGVGAAQVVEDVGVSSDGGADVDADGGCVDDVDAVMTSGAIFRMASGSGCPAARAFSAGNRLSRTRVVLPEPEAPVTAASRPRGMYRSRAWTVCSGAARRWMRTVVNTSLASGRVRTRIFQSLPHRRPGLQESMAKHAVFSHSYAESK